MNKIDYFGGLHGNYLELIVNVFVYQNGYDLSQSPFDAKGSCHRKNTDPTYVRHIHAYHFSFDSRPIQPTDQVVRIVPKRQDLLIALTNGFLRAGDEEIDLDRLGRDMEHLTSSSKGKAFVDKLDQKNLSRSQVRGYFYSMLSHDEHALDNMLRFDDTSDQVHHFPFRAFFDWTEFYHHVNETAEFLNFNFYPTPRLGEIHREFLSVNQGLKSEQKCHAIWSDILCGLDRPIKLNVLEEAWINHQISQGLRGFDLPELNQEHFPSTTGAISRAIFDWKSRDL